MTAPAKKRRRAEAAPGGYVRLPDGTTWRSPLLALRQATTEREIKVAAAYHALANVAPKRAAYILRHLRAFDRRTRRGETP